MHRIFFDLIFFTICYFAFSYTYRASNIPKIRISSAKKKGDFYKVAKLLFHQKSSLFEWVKTEWVDEERQDIFGEGNSLMSMLSMKDQEKVMVLIMRRYKASSRIRKAIFLKGLSTKEAIVFEEYVQNDGRIPFWKTALQTAKEKYLNPLQSGSWRDYFNNTLAFVFKSEIEDEELRHYFKFWLFIHRNTIMYSTHNDRYIDREGKRRGYYDD